MEFCDRATNNATTLRILSNYTNLWEASVYSQRLFLALRTLQRAWQSARQIRHSGHSLHARERRLKTDSYNNNNEKHAHTSRQPCILGQQQQQQRVEGDNTETRDTEKCVHTCAALLFSRLYASQCFFFLHIFFWSYSCPALKRVSPEGSPSSRGQTCRDFFAAPLRDNVCLLAVVTSVVGVVVLVSVSVGGVFVSLSFILRERAQKISKRSDRKGASYAGRTHCCEQILKR